MDMHVKSVPTGDKRMTLPLILPRGRQVIIKRKDNCLNNQQAMKQAHIGISIKAHVLQRWLMGLYARSILPSEKDGPQEKDRTTQMRMAQGTPTVIGIFPVFVVIFPRSILRLFVRRRRNHCHGTHRTIQHGHHATSVDVEVHQYQHQHTQNTQRMTPACHRMFRRFIHLLLAQKN